MYGIKVVRDTGSILMIFIQHITFIELSKDQTNCDIYFDNHNSVALNYKKEVLQFYEGLSKLSEDVTITVN